MAWTDERIEQLKRMWEGGMTASQIADELGGVSRNAVIGKAHRLGLQSRPSPVKPNDVGGNPTHEIERQAPIAAPAPVAAPAAPPPPAAEPVERPASASQQPILRSIGPGGFVRQSPGEQQQPSAPAPPRRLVPAKPSAEVAGKTSLLDLNDKICKWPIGHPGEPDFHFCGSPINPGFPY